MKNNRTFLEKLLDGAVVEWKPLKDILIRTKGTKITAAEMKILHKDNAPLKIFAGGKTFALVNFEDIPEKDINKNPSIIVKSRGIIEFEYYDKPFSHKNEMWSYYSNDKNINIKYIYYVLKNQEPYFQNLGSKMQMPQIAIPDTDKYLVPIPPLSVQTEIVKILDALTALTSELTSELTLRRKQYEYYLDNLLSKEELGKIGFEWKCLKDICDYVDFRGKTPKKTESGIFLVTAKNIKKGFIDYNASKEFVSESDYIEIMRRGLPRIGDVLITTEAPCGNVAQIDKEDIALAQRVIKYRSSNENILDNTFLKFMLLSKEFQVNLIKLSTGGTVKGIKGSTLHKMKIKIPPIDEQKRIVSILEKFEILTNSITEGLPLAIEQSQKRYEYYRELLLSFNGSNQ